MKGPQDIKTPNKNSIEFRMSFATFLAVLFAIGILVSRAVSIEPTKIISCVTAVLDGIFLFLAMRVAVFIARVLRRQKR